MSKNTIFSVFVGILPNLFFIFIVLIFSGDAIEQNKILISIILMAIIFVFCITSLEGKRDKKNHKVKDDTSINFLLKNLLTSRLHSSIIHKVLALDSLNGGPDDSPSFFKSNIWYTIRHNPETHDSFMLYLSQVAELIKKIGSVSFILPNEVWSRQSRDLVRSVEYLDSLFRNDSISDVFAVNWNKIFTQEERDKAISVVNDVIKEQTKTLKEVADILDKKCSEYKSTRQSEVGRNLDALRVEYMKGTLVESRIVNKQDDHDTAGESSISDVWE